jgi:hypothetical protein
MGLQWDAGASMRRRANVPVSGVGRALGVCDRGAVLVFFVLLVAVGEFAVDRLLVLACGGELAGVLERLGELLAGGGDVAQRAVSLFGEILGEFGQGAGAMLELTDRGDTGAA